MSRSSYGQRCCVAHIYAKMPGRKDEQETYRPPPLQPFIFFWLDGRDSFYNISQFISSEPEPSHFHPFLVKISSSPHRDDVLSDCYSCVIEHALWKGRAPSVAKSSLALLHRYERKCLHNPQRNANFEVHVQLCNPSGAQGDKGGKICHILIRNRCLSSFTPLILWRFHKLLTVKLSALPTSVSPSLL